MVENNYKVVQSKASVASVEIRVPGWKMNSCVAAFSLP